MRIVNALLIALSTYSRIPVPQAEWNEENQRYAMCFFPAVGLLVGAALWGWLLLCDALGLSALLRGAVGAVIPLLVTGGIHMDGMMDTVDAMASWKGPEERLAILKDSHVGAFAVMACAGYLLVSAAALGSARADDALPLTAVFVLSRALSALAMTWLRGARKEGMLSGVARASSRRAVSAACALWAVPACAALLCRHVLPGLAAMLAAALVLLVYRSRSYRWFGGVTGDLAGWFLQVCELACVLCVVIGGGLAG